MLRSCQPCLREMAVPQSSKNVEHSLSVTAACSDLVQPKSCIPLETLLKSHVFLPPLLVMLQPFALIGLVSELACSCCDALRRFKGVEKERGREMVVTQSANIKVAGVKFHLGSWPTQELAAEAYDKAALCINVCPPHLSA